jgi:GNAT superfamily N-acetyltransferase
MEAVRMDPMPQPLIRDARPADFPQWKTLWDAYNAFYGRTGPTALAPAVTESTWRRILDEAEPVHALVAERDGHLVGLAHYLFHRTTNAVGPICYLQDLFTDEAHRRGGVGRALIERVRERAKAAGAVRVYWQTHESNAAARALYDRIARNSGFLVYRMSLD